MNKIYPSHPVHCHHNHSCCDMDCFPPAPPGFTVKDWVAYINSYIDVRARQLYDKLKGLYSQQIDDATKVVHDYVLLKDQATGQIKKLYISNDNLFTDDV